MDQIFIKDLRARGIIGVNDWERTQSQEIIINVTLFIDLSLAGKNDDLDETISYSTIAEKLIGHAVNAQYFTVEGLAHGLANICLDEAKVSSVRIRVEKPAAIAEASSAGVEIERSRAR